VIRNDVAAVHPASANDDGTHLVRHLRAGILYHQWLTTTDREEQTRIWKEMLAINAKNIFNIGTVARELQPVVVSNKLHNVPEKALFAFEPTSYFGVYRMEEFFFTE